MKSVESHLTHDGAGAIESEAWMRETHVYSSASLLLPLLLLLARYFLIFGFSDEYSCSEVYDGFLPLALLDCRYAVAEARARVSLGFLGRAEKSPPRFSSSG